MNCQEMEVLLCDYMDGILDAAARQAADQHLAGCPDCATLLRDCTAAVAFLGNVPDVEPPADLITRILYHSPAGPEPVQAKAEGPGASSGILHWVRGLLQPILQPRFAMGMAMTILSFSMVGRIAGVQQRQLTMADLDPVKVWATFDDTLHRGYDRAVKYYENLRLVYEIQARLKEWSAQEDEFRRSQATGTVLTPDAREDSKEGQPSGDGNPPGELKP
ncbi:MAG: zf-HC2 domain-containing protein [Acidobacteriia bacterium]|nr:zf-HC2 domain-containing protein [Terriglobia bacterium]